MLAIDVIQQPRIQHLWEAIELENETLKQAKEKNIPKIKVFENGDIQKQLLARSHYLLYKSREKWTKSQKIRAYILVENYLDIEKAYTLSDKLKKIYNQNIPKSVV